MNSTVIFRCMRPVNSPANVSCPAGVGTIDIVLRAVLLFFVAVAGPWVVHIAPARQRLMALVGFVGVLVFWLLFENWTAKWWFWVGLLVGAITALLLGHTTGSQRPPPRRRPPRSNDLTEEF